MKAPSRSSFTAAALAAGCLLASCLPANKPVLALADKQPGARSIAWAPDGGSIAVSSDSPDAMKLYDAKSGAPLKSFEVGEDSPGDLAFSPDGRFIVSAGGEAGILVWDLATAKLARAITFAGKKAGAIALSADGKKIAMSYRPKKDEEAMRIDVLDFATGTFLYGLDGHEKTITHLAFLPDGSRLYSTSYERDLKAWDLPSGRMTADIWAHSGTTDALAVASGGSMIATGGGSNDYIGGAVPYTIKVYPAPDCETNLLLKGHSKPVTCLAFSPDGSRLVSGSWEKVLKLWDASTGKCVGTLKGNADRISCVAMSPDGSRVASGASDGAVLIWDMPSAVR
jgi:WD40 repeat protein